MSVIQETQLGKNKMHLIRCHEPQRIYDLLKRNGIRCDKVWNATMSISSTAPCTALIQQNMPIIYATNVTDELIGLSSPGSNCVFYHNMKYVRVLTRRHTMRHKPYLISEDHDTFPSMRDIFSNNAVQSYVVEDPKPTVLYYSDPLSSAKAVVRADGRFLDSCKITRLGEDCDLGEQHICDFEPNELCIDGKCVCLCSIITCFTYNTGFSFFITMYVYAGDSTLPES